MNSILYNLVVTFILRTFRGDLERCDSNGRSPLHTAAAYGHVAAIELMIGHGANLWALDTNGRTAAKSAAFHKKVDACRYLDTLAIRWEAENKEYVEKMQVKAMKELKKRVKKASEEGSKESKPGSGKVAKRLLYDHATAPPGTASPLTEAKARAHGTEAGGRKKKLSTTDALRENFELRSSNSTGNVEDGGREGDEEAPFKTHSAGSTFRPVPRMNAGPMLNTLQSLTPSLTEVRKTSMESGLGRSVASESSSMASHRNSRQTAGTLPQLSVVPSTGSMIVENNSSLATFLQALDLVECIQLLHKEKLDLDALALCNETDLIGIGLQLGPRKKILHAIERRQQLMASPGRLADTDL